MGPLSDLLETMKFLTKRRITLNKLDKLKTSQLDPLKVYPHFSAREEEADFVVGIEDGGFRRRTVRFKKLPRAGRANNTPNAPNYYLSLNLIRDYNPQGLLVREFRESGAPSLLESQFLVMFRCSTKVFNPPGSWYGKEVRS